MKQLGAVIAAVAMVLSDSAVPATEPADTLDRFVAAGGIAKRNESGTGPSCQPSSGKWAVPLAFC